MENTNCNHNVLAVLPNKTQLRRSGEEKRIFLQGLLKNTDFAVRPFCFKLFFLNHLFSQRDRSSHNQSSSSLLPLTRRKRCQDHVGELPNCIFKWFLLQMVGVQVNTHGRGSKRALPESSPMGLPYESF